MAYSTTHDLMPHPEMEGYNQHLAWMQCKRCSKTRYRSDVAGWPSTYEWFTVAGWKDWDQITPSCVWHDTQLDGVCHLY